MRPISLHLPGSYTTHDVFIPPTFNTPAIAHSATVYINGLPVHRERDVSEIHCVPIAPPICDVEVIAPGSGFPRIIVEGKPLAALPAATTNRCLATFGSHSVFANPV